MVMKEDRMEKWQPTGPDPVTSRPIVLTLHLLSHGALPAFSNPSPL